MCLACQLKSVRSTNSGKIFKDNQEEKENNESKANSFSSHPDGGCLAWTIVAASFMVSFLQDGFRDSFGLILPVVSKQFGVGRAEAALTNSIMTFLTLGSGPLVAVMVKKFGHRIVTLVGVCLSTIGLFLAGVYIDRSDAPSILVLYLTVGVLVGLGFGLMYLPAMDIVEIYFSKNLGVATGIAAAGSGFGQFVMAPAIHIVQEQLGLEGTFYTLGGVVSTAVIFGLIYKLPSNHSRGKGCDNLAFQFEEETKRNGNTGLKQNKTKTERINTEKEEDTENLQNLKESFIVVFQSPAMVLLLLSHFLLHLGIFAAFSFTTDRAVQFGISKYHTSILLSIMGVANCLGRILFGKILDHFRSKAILLTSIVLLTNALSVVLSGLAPSFVGQAIYAAIFGSTFGAYISSVVVILKIIMNDITVSLGISLFTFAIASLVGPTSVGYLFDITGSYSPGFLAVGLGSVVGALILPLVAFALPRTQQYTVNTEEQRS